jgi:uncharacterized protein
MMKKIASGVVIGVVLVVVSPVVLTQLKSHPTRKLQGVELKDTKFKEVTFVNSSAGLRLSGMAFVPEGTGPFPSIVIIQGSGNSQRNNRWYLTLAHYLQNQGIAVLLPDKRGCEQSEGNWRKASFFDLASDAITAIQTAKSGTYFPVSKIGVVGMSQGGHIAPLVAAESKDVDFVVNVVGSSLPMHETLLYEEVNNLRDFGFLPGASNVLARISTLYLRKVAQADFLECSG